MKFEKEFGLFAYSPVRPFAGSPIHLFTYFTYSPIHPFTYSPSYGLSGGYFFSSALNRGCDRSGLNSG